MINQLWNEETLGKKQPNMELDGIDEDSPVE